MIGSGGELKHSTYAETISRRVEGKPGDSISPRSFLLSHTILFYFGYTNQVIFLGVVFSKGVSVDPDKIWAIVE